MRHEWDEAVKEPHHRTAFQLHIPFALGENLQLGKDQKAAKHKDDPMECLEQRHPGDDKHGPQDERAHDAPEQDPVLKRGGHRAVRDNHHNDEDVINAEGLFNQVARQEFKRQLSTKSEGDPHIETQRKGDPDRGPNRGFA